MSKRSRSFGMTIKGCVTALLAVFVVQIQAGPADAWTAWKPVAEGGAVVEVAQDSSLPLDAQNTNALRLTVKDLGQRAGVVNTSELNVQAGKWYDLSFYASTENNKHFALTVSLESADGKVVGARATIPEVGGEWSKFHLALSAHQTASNCRVVITLAETGTIWLNAVTLVPRSTP